MKRRAFTLVEVMIVVVIIGLLLAMAVPACKKAMYGDTEDRQKYELWCKLERRTDITFEEWKQLRKDNQLSHRLK